MGEFMQGIIATSSTTKYDEEGEILGWSLRWPSLEGGIEEAQEFWGCIGSGQKQRVEAKENEPVGSRHFAKKVLIETRESYVGACFKGCSTCHNGISASSSDACSCCSAVPNDGLRKDMREVVDLMKNLSLNLLSNTGANWDPRNPFNQAIGDHL